MSETTKLYFKYLNDFLNSSSVKITDKADKNITHTCMGDKNLNIYNAKYRINKEYYKYFINLYCKWIFEYNFEHHLTEKHHPEFSPVLIDIDFRYNKTNDEIIRLYNNNTIISLITEYIDILVKYIDIDNEQKKCFVMEKSKPIFDKNKNIIKDGIHIIFPFIVSKYEPLFLTRLEVIKNQKLIDIFKNLKYINNIEDIVDEAVIKRNNWFMYGSSKPGKEVYKVTKIFTFQNNKFEIDNNIKYKENDYVELFSINKFDEKYICPIINEGLIKSQLEKIEGKKINKLNKNTNKKTGFKKTTTMEDLAITKKLVKILSNKRADSFEPWIRVGWCLHNIDYTLLEAWIEFSMKSSKFQEGICEEKWETMDNRGLSIGSLHRWCKEDNLEEYKKIIKEDLDSLLRISLNKTDFDIAKVIYRLYKYDFVCCSAKTNQWYMFKNHRWHPSDSAVELKRKISEEVVYEYSKYASECSRKVLETQEEEEKETLIKRGIKSNEICLKLKNETFKTSVVKACSQLFSDPKFMEKLDSNTELIGFNNGIYDLEKKEFRNGFAEDFISFSTNIDYKDYNFDDEIIKNIKEFLSQVLPINRVKDYVLKVIASFLSGKTGEEKFHIWTGCHSIDTKIIMADGRIKKVQNIKKNEYVMGPDSKPRKVLDLIRGKSKMYEIRLNDNSNKHYEKYNINEDHIMVLINNNNISHYDNNKNFIELKWYEKDNFGYPTLTYKKFIYNKYNKINKIQECNSYLEELLQSSKLIKKGEKIEISCKEAIKRNLNDKDFKIFKTYIDFDEKKTQRNPYDVGCELIKYKYKNIPSEYLYNNKKNRKELLAGILDTNLIIDEENKVYKIKNKNSDLINDILYLIRTLGIKAHTTMKNKILSYISNHELTITGNINFLPCKNDIVNFKNKNDLTYSFKIFEMKEDNYYGFRLDKDHLYLTDDFIVQHNCGGNGKSKLIELFEYAFGDYCGKMSVTLITQKRAASNACTPELVANKGKRFVTLQEPDNNEEIHVGAMKELTGGDKIQGRGLHKDPIQFKPQWKMVMTSNVLPQVSSNERGTWRRIRVTEFVSRFVEVTEFDPKKKYQFTIDYDLSSKLKEWPEAFMWYLIQEYYKYKSQGLKEPPEVIQNTKAYEEESDTFTQFANEKIKESPGDKIRCDDVYHIYKEWFKNAGINIKPPTKKDLIKNLSMKFGPHDRNKMWKGLNFIETEFEDNEDDDE